MYGHTSVLKEESKIYCSPNILKEESKIYGLIFFSTGERADLNKSCNLIGSRIFPSNPPQWGDSVVLIFFLE